MALQAGMDAPQFELPDADMEMFRLSDLRGKKNAVLYFYPKDDTPGCTMEANEFTELEDEFAKLDTVVIGVSRDDCLSHAEFRDKHGLSVLLLADTEGQVCETYGVLVDKELPGGMVRAIEDGYLQGLIADEAYRIHQEVEDGTRPVVGVNRFVSDEPAPDLVTADLSFISLTLVLPALVSCAGPEADFVVLVKPQFEVGKGRVGAGGVVRDPGLRAEAVASVAAAAAALGLGVAGLTSSPLPGPSGNVEYFLWLLRDAPALDPGRLQPVVSERPQ